MTPLLSRGDRVSVVAPAFAPRPDVLEAGLAALRRRGYRVEPGAHLGALHGYFAGDDRARAEDLARALTEPGLRAVWFARGGYGTARLLAGGAARAARRREGPVLVGHSDLTALFAQLPPGRIALHGPFVTELARPAAFHAPSLRACLAGAPVTVRFRAGQVLRPGRVQGPLAGGNLTVLVHLLGTPFEPDLRGRIVLLEDVGEETYRLDRLLTHLVASGALRRAAGLVLGRFDPPPTRRPFPPDLPLEAVVREVLGPLDLPVVTGLPLGHGDGKWTVPLGGRAALDTAAGRLAVEPRG